MAPPHTLGRPTARRSKSTRANLAFSTDNPISTESSFVTTKHDKRLIKHSAFISRVQKSSRDRTKVVKRRRSGKKLVTDLRSLGDALPGITEAVNVEGQATDRPELVKLRKSLRSKPGAMKKREKVVKEERDRFEQNLAGMLAIGGGHTGAQRADGYHEGNLMERWKVLRMHLEQGKDAKKDADIG